MAKPEGNRSTAKSIFGLCRRKSKKNKDKKPIENVEKEAIQEQVAPKRKISSKHSLSIPPFEASLDWDTGQLFMPSEEEHIITKKNGAEIRHRNTSDRLFVNQQVQQQQQNSNNGQNDEKAASTIIGLENRLFHRNPGLNEQKQQKTADQTERTTLETFAVSHPRGTVQREDKELDYSFYDGGIFASNALPINIRETVDSTTIEENGKLSTSSSITNTSSVVGKTAASSTTSFVDNRPNLIEKAKINSKTENRIRAIDEMERTYEFQRNLSGASSPSATIDDITKNFDEIIQHMESTTDDCLSKNLQSSWNRTSKVNIAYTKESPQFRKSGVQSTEKAHLNPRGPICKENQRFSTIAVGRSDKDKNRGTVKSVFQNGNRKVEDSTAVQMRGQDGCFGPVSRARSVLILSNIDNVDDNQKLNDSESPLSPSSMKRYEPKIRVSCFEDEYYEKETLKDDEYLHTIKFGYSDTEGKKVQNKAYSTPPNNLVIVHPSTLTPNADENRKYRRNIDPNRRKTTEIFSTPAASEVRQQQPPLVKSTTNDRPLTTLRKTDRKLSSSMSNLHTIENGTRTFKKNGEQRKEVKDEQPIDNEDNEDMDVGKMLQQQRLEKEYEILNTLVQQWQDYSKRNEQKIKKGGTLTVRDLTRSQQLQTAMMEQQKTIDKLLLAPKAEPSPTLPTTAEPAKPSIDTDNLVYKSGPAPYRSIYSSNGNIDKMDEAKKSAADLTPNRPLFELSSSRKSSINPTGSTIGHRNSVEIQIPVRRTSRSFYNEFSRGQSPLTIGEQRQGRRDSSSSYKLSSPTNTTLPADDVWDYGARRRSSKNEILKPSQLFAYSAKKHENDDILSMGRSHSPTPTAALRTDRRPASNDGVPPQTSSSPWRPLSGQSPAGRYSSVYQSSSQYFSSLANRHPATSSDTEAKKFYFKNFYAPNEPSAPVVKKPEETWREDHTKLMRELRDFNKF